MPEPVRIETPPTDRAEVRKDLLAILGVGPWTTEMIPGFGLADPDTLPLGDLYLPGPVGRARDGEEDADDARIVDAARAFRGQRFRVMRRLWSAVFHAQRLLRPLMSAGEILAGHLVRTRAWGARRRCVRRLSSSPSLHESPRPSTTRTMTRPNDRPLGLQHRPCRSMNRANLVVLDTGR